VNEDASRQREHLSLVLHAAERSRENQTVVVAFELAAVVMALYVAVFLSEALVRNQFFPIHIENGYFVQSYKNVEKSVPVSARNALPLHPTTKYQPLLWGCEASILRWDTLPLGDNGHISRRHKGKKSRKYESSDILFGK
jgi:hypothetical protein